jgi:TonB family protein
VARVLQLLRAYANDDPALDYRSRFLGNLMLAVAFSSALHAAALSTLELIPVRMGDALSFRFNAELREPPAPAAAAGPASALRPPSKPEAREATTLPARYLTAREVDTPAVPRETPPLIYPEGPFLWKLKGMVRVRLYISERGNVDKAEVVRAEPRGDFEEAALDAVRRMVYEPAIRDGRPVKSQKLIEVTFDPYEASGPGSGR